MTLLYYFDLMKITSRNDSMSTTNTSPQVKSQMTYNAIILCCIPKQPE